MLVGDVTELALPTPLWLVVVLAAACAWSFRDRASRLGRARWALVALLGWSVALSTPALANALVAALEGPRPAAPPPAGGAPIILVLSSGSTPRGEVGWDAKLDVAGWERTWAGIRLWNRIGGELLFAGQPTPDGTSSVAARMADVAIASGVPAGKALVEGSSRNTYENLSFSRDRLAGRDVWLVTSALHMRRAVAVARKLGIAVRPAPCDFRAQRFEHWYAWLPNSGGPEMYVAALHELLGLAYYRWRGWAS